MTPAVVDPVEILKVPPYIKLEEAKIYFGLDRDYVRRLIRDRKIKGSKVGKRWLVVTASLLKHIKRGERHQGKFVEEVEDHNNEGGE